MISYFVDNNLETGIVQAFRFRKSDLYLIALVEENEKTAKTRRVFAGSCKCQEIMNIDEIQEIMKRDQVTVEDLKVIENFEWKYAEALKKGGEKKQWDPF